MSIPKPTNEGICIIIPKASSLSRTSKSAFCFKLSNMKKIVIKVGMHCDKSRIKAMKMAIVQGVHSVSLEGESRDQMVVTGDGVDSVCLANQLRKKFRYAFILSVEDLKSGAEEAVNTENQGTGPEYVPPTCYSYGWPYSPSCPMYYEVVYDRNPSWCSIV